MSFGRLGGRGDDRLRKFLVLDHAVRERHSAEGPLSSLVLSPGVTCKIASDDHLDLERLASVADGHGRIRNRDLPVRENVGRRIQELRCDEIQNLTFERDSGRKNDIECRNPVRHYHHEILPVDVINVTYLSDIFSILSGKVEICFCDCCHTDEIDYDSFRCETGCKFSNPQRINCSIR